MVENNVKIMIVDDTEANRLLLEDLLEDDFQLNIANDGLLCLQQYDDFQPDIILLDVMMPNMNGYEACAELRKKYTASDVCIIMVSAADQIEDKLAGYKAGCDDYLSKPVDANILLAKIELSLANLAKKKDQKKRQDQLHEQFQMAETTTLEVMSTFLQDIVKSPDFNELARSLRKATKALGIQSAVKIYDVDQTIVVGCQPDSGAWALLQDAQNPNAELIPQLFKSKHVILLAANLPREVSPVVEQLSDRINILSRGVDARVQSLLEQPIAAEQGETDKDLDWIVSENYSAISQAKQQFIDHDLLTHTIMDQLMQDMDALLIKLGLTEEQETTLIKCLENSADQLHSLSVGGTQISNTLDKSLVLLKNLIKGPDVELF
jgi:CheY-like chemotaxis protein